MKGCRDYPYCSHLSTNRWVPVSVVPPYGIWSVVDEPLEEATKDWTNVHEAHLGKGLSVISA